ncbi:MAG: NUDIX hydrolase [Saprospiraceae bacterium]|nr:NUDIX hydrolase [Saprospiraceae bacterium]
MKLNKSIEENINSWISQINVEYKLALSVDCVIFGYTTRDMFVALTKCDMPPFEGDYSLVGDIVQPSENLDQAANRILQERTGLTNVYLEQVQTFSETNRHPLGRVVTVAYYSLIKLNEYYDKLPGEDFLIWRNIKDVDTLAFDHKEIFDVCLSRLQKQVKEQPVGFNLLPKKFTLNQLQELYEVILGVELDKRNFRRKLKSLNILQDHDELQTDVSHRPAKLYSFNKKLYEQRVADNFLF